MSRGTVLYVCNNQLFEPDIKYILGKFNITTTISTQITFEEIDNVSKLYDFIFVIMCDKSIINDEQIIKLNNYLNPNGIIYVKSHSKVLINVLNYKMEENNFKIFNLPSNTLDLFMPEKTSTIYYTGYKTPIWTIKNLRDAYKTLSLAESKIIDDIFLNQINNNMFNKTYYLHDIVTYDSYDFNDFVNEMKNGNTKLSRNGYSVNVDKTKPKYKTYLFRVHIVLLNEALFTLNPKFSNDNLIKQAMSNIYSIPTKKVNELKIYVTKQDWNVATREYTHKYGAIFAVLNMAHESKFGGEYKHGLPGQEENMFRVSTCMLYAGGVKEDGLYYEYITNQLKGNDEFTLLDTRDVRVIFRDTEEQGYNILTEEQYVPFYELRSSPINIHNKEFTYDECEKRIDKQLDTLSKHKVRHVILSAFGCGSYGNDPIIISRIYKEKIEMYKSFFDVIVFAIYTPPKYDNINYTEFCKTFGK